MSRRNDADADVDGESADVDADPDPDEAGTPVSKAKFEQHLSLAGASLSRPVVRLWPLFSANSTRPKKTAQYTFFWWKIVVFRYTHFMYLLVEPECGLVLISTGRPKKKSTINNNNKNNNNNGENDNNDYKN